MIATTHLAVGAAIGLWSSRMAAGYVSSEPELVQVVVKAGTAFFAATISHIVLDSIPHNDGIYKTTYGAAPVLGPELVIIFSAILWITILKDLDSVVIFAGLIGAAWLDVLSMLGFSLSIHDSFHSLRNPGLIGSLAVQLFIIVAALIFLF